MTNIKDETKAEQAQPDSAGDLEVFQPSPPAHRIDDKAATLEDELQDLKLRFNRERFMYAFIMAVMFVCLVGPSLSNGLLAFLIAAALIFTISLGKYLDFPWAVVPLERWHDLLYEACKKKLLGKDDEVDTEPFEDE